VLYVFVTASHYAAILFPHSPGSVRDLARSAELGNIVAHFVEENSKKKFCKHHNLYNCE